MQGITLWNLGDMTQEQIAHAFGVRRSTVAMWLTWAREHGMEVRPMRNPLDDVLIDARARGMDNYEIGLMLGRSARSVAVAFSRLRRRGHEVEFSRKRESKRATVDKVIESDHEAPNAAGAGEMAPREGRD